MQDFCLHRLLYDNGYLFSDNKDLLIVPGGGTGCPMAWDKMSQGVGQMLCVEGAKVPVPVAPTDPSAPFLLHLLVVVLRFFMQHFQRNTLLFFTKFFKHVINLFHQITCIRITNRISE